MNFRPARYSFLPTIESSSYVVDFHGVPITLVRTNMTTRILILSFANSSKFIPFHYTSCISLVENANEMSLPIIVKLADPSLAATKLDGG